MRVLMIIVALAILAVGCADKDHGHESTHTTQTIIQKDGSKLTKVTVPKGQCVKIYDSVYAENIKDGSHRVFDVYPEATCSDEVNEYCDNVVPSEANTGKVDAYRGSGTNCVVDKLIIFGTMVDNDGIEITVLDYN